MKVLTDACRFIGRATRFLVYGTILLAFFIFSVFIILLFFAPAMIMSENNALVGVGAFMYHIALVMCHQLPYRTFHFFGAHQPLCARDVGLYLGFITGISINLANKTPKFLKSYRSPVLLTLPILVDGSAQTIFALWESSNLSRVVTGFLFGLGIPCYIASKMMKKYSDFRGVLAGNFLALFVSALLVNYILLGVVSMYTTGYLTKGGAISIAQNISQRDYTQAFYIAPKVPISLHWDPFFDRYDDQVLRDIKVMNLSKSYGIWVVVLSDDIGEKGAVFTSVHGEYFYINPVTREVIERKSH